MRHRVQITKFIACLGALALVACSSPPSFIQEGGPVTPIHPLVAEHPGWQQPRCVDCHPQPHNQAYGFDECAACHGDNGAPQLTESHTGWRYVSCDVCHVQSDAHGGLFQFTACGGCHGGNGAPARPDPHWLDGCNDCHADGTLMWNACSHAGLAEQAPRACIYCHK
jgi:hypothetical protein